MKLIIFCLVLLTAPFAIASEPLTLSLYGAWLTDMIREPTDHWPFGDTYALGIGLTGVPEMFAYQTCGIGDVLFYGQCKFSHQNS
jgi:hypothetical protein